MNHKQKLKSRKSQPPTNASVTLPMADLTNRSEPGRGTPNVERPAETQRGAWVWTWQTILGCLSLAAVFLVAYWPVLKELVATWEREPDYSHGYLVVPVALY